MGGPFAARYNTRAALPARHPRRLPEEHFDGPHEVGPRGEADAQAEAACDALGHQDGVPVCHLHHLVQRPLPGRGLGWSEGGFLPTFTTSNFNAVKLVFEFGRGNLCRHSTGGALYAPTTACLQRVSGLFPAYSVSAQPGCHSLGPVMGDSNNLKQINFLGLPSFFDVLNGLRFRQFCS